MIGVEKVKVLGGHCVGRIINFHIIITKIYNSNSVRETFIQLALNILRNEGEETGVEKGLGQ